MKKKDGALLGVAAASLGYNTHDFGTINGEYAPKDIAGQYQSLSRYVKDEYQRVWGFRNAYNGEISEETKFPVAGNCIFIDAIVIGKPAAGETVETWGTNHARPQNWAYWDGVPNEKPSPAAAVKEDAAIELGENEYFVVGDNRINSHDSRSDDVGVITKDMLVGRVRHVIWPLSDIRAVE